MKGCFEKATGRPLEWQSNARAGTLIDNAIVNGFAAEDVSEEDISFAEWQIRRTTWEADNLPVEETFHWLAATSEEQLEEVRRRLNIPD
jgi:hypothetical protein